MALSNLENRVKQDSAYPRTAEDAIRRDKDIDKVTIKASQIELEGYTTINGGFKIDNTGNMECKNAKVTGGKFTVTSTDLNPEFTLMDGNTLAESDYINNMYAGGLSVTKRTGLSSIFTLSVYNGGLTPAGRLTLGDGTNDNIIIDGELGEITGESIGLYNNGTNNIYLDGYDGNITCVSLTQTSLAEKKKNFEKLENALDIVKDVDIYKYNLKDEKETDKKHIGFVIGDKYKYREEITSAKNDGAEIYPMVSVLWKAVQEQQAEIEKLRKLVNK